MTIKPDLPTGVTASVITTKDINLVNASVQEANEFVLMCIILNVIKARNDLSFKHLLPRNNRTNLRRYVVLMCEDAADSIDDNTFMAVRKTSMAYRPRASHLFALLYAEKFNRDRDALKEFVLSHLDRLLDQGGMK